MDVRDDLLEKSFDVFPSVSVTDYSNLSRARLRQPVRPEDRRPAPQARGGVEKAKRPRQPSRRQNPRRDGEGDHRAQGLFG